MRSATSDGRRLECEPVWVAGAELGEGPCWDPRVRHVIWVDIKAATLHAFSVDDGSRRSWRPRYRLCSLDLPPVDWRPPASLPGRVYLGCGDMGFGWIGITDDEVDVIPMANPERDRPGNRYNDGKRGPDGRYWAGTMDAAERQATGGLYVFGPDGQHTTLDSGYQVPNGPAFSPDGATVYQADSPRRAIYAFDLTPDGTLARKRTFVRFSAREGCPDGMTTDSEGNLWVAMWDGGRVEKLSPDGDRCGAVRVPAARPTSCTFADGDLYITSARAGRARQEPLAGSLFRVQVA